MRNVLTLILSLLIFGGASAQTVLSGQVRRTNGDTVKYQTVTLRPDTTSIPPFNTMIDTTDSIGRYAFQIPNGVPNNFRMYLDMVNCDNNVKTDTLFYNGANMSYNITLCFNIVTPTVVRGYVHLGSPAKRPVPGRARVYMIQRCSGIADTLTFIDSVLTDTNGYYEFANYPVFDPNCGLLMSARLLPTSTDYEKYLPAYHLTQTSYALRWYDGLVISKTYAGNGVNILLPEAQNPFGGPAILAGKARLKGTTTLLPNKVIFLTDMQDVTVAYKYTDGNGEFSFDNLQFGTYKMFGDVWNVSNPDFIVTVNSSNVFVKNIVFFEDNIEFKGGYPVGVSNVSGDQQSLSLFPNPANDVVYIRGLDAIDGNKKVTITSIEGKVISGYEYRPAAKVSVPVSELTKGVYLINIKTDAGNSVLKMLK
ncbi:MAG: T9SS type A sorting domain-containing protein [Chitinophagales bacterium]|nr:T9SS type A sorting domain-containing protein [Chitinophagaceae bacterium]MCB9065793.1 T9SS type A sorting domain-containing protein [Chitinophagales bacterium]